MAKRKPTGWKVWFLKHDEDEESFSHVVGPRTLPCVPAIGDEVMGTFLPDGFVKGKVVGRKFSFRLRRVIVLLKLIKA